MNSLIQTICEKTLTLNNGMHSLFLDFRTIGKMEKSLLQAGPRPPHHRSQKRGVQWPWSAHTNAKRLEVAPKSYKISWNATETGCLESRLHEQADCTKIYQLLAHGKTLLKGWIRLEYVYPIFIYFLGMPASLAPFSARTYSFPRFSLLMPLSGGKHCQATPNIPKPIGCLYFKPFRDFGVALHGCSSQILLSKSLFFHVQSLCTRHERNKLISMSMMS